MKEVLQKKTLFVVIPLLIALLSVFVLSGPASSPDLHGSTLAALEEKQTTVLELSAASAAACFFRYIRFNFSIVISQSF